MRAISSKIHFSVVPIIGLVIGFQFISLYVGAQNDSTHFVTTWKTSNPGISDSRSIVIATDKRYAYNFDVDWNDDGFFDDLGVTESISHQYAKEGSYSIRIRGIYPRIAFEKTSLSPVGDQLKLLSIDQWGNNVWQDLSYAFAFCENLQIYAKDTPDLSKATDLSYLFANATYFTGDLENWDVSSVTNMEGMFFNAKIFNSDLFYWDVTSVKSMKSMFQGAANFHQDLYTWEMGSVTDLSYMFKDAIRFNGDISDWNVYNAENIEGMFMGCEAFDKQFISSWVFSPDVRKGNLYTVGSNINYTSNYFTYGLISILVEVAFYALLF